MRSSHMPRLHKFSVYKEEEHSSQLSHETDSNVSPNGFIRENDQKFATEKKVKTSQLGFKTELEHPQSSGSDTTTEADLAFCLMMLSRDKWKKNKKRKRSSQKVVEEINIEESNRTKTTKGRYKCETCGKVFKSYQALGGHRASHKKNRVSNKTEQQSKRKYDDAITGENRIHKCPVCFRVFASGQALGGHKRSHGIGTSLSVDHSQVHMIESIKQRMIDLNLPAPTYDEEEDASINAF